MTARAAPRVGTLLVALTLLLTVTPAAAHAGGRYVALGDSLAVGQQASDPDSRGYVPLFFDFLKTADGGGLDELRNHGVPGETSGSLRTGGQLASGLIDVTDPATDTKVVSLDIGANDGFDCSSGYHQPSCPFAANFSDTLNDLNGALAGDPGSEDLLVMAYFNPATGTGTQGEADGDSLLLGSDGTVDCAGTGAQRGLNDLIACIGASKGAGIADVYPAFESGGQAFMSGDQFHPNDAGYAAIADEFKRRRTRPAPDGGGGSGTPPPATGSPTPATDSPPANHFSIGSLRTASDGTATIVLGLPGPGAIDLLASARVARRAAARTLRVARIRRSVAAAGSVRLRIRPSRGARSVLRRRRRLRVALRIKFTPTGGSPRVRTRAVTLRLKRRR